MIILNATFDIILCVSMTEGYTKTNTALTYSCWSDFNLYFKFVTLTFCTNKLTLTLTNTLISICPHQYIIYITRILSVPIHIGSATSLITVSYIYCTLTRNDIMMTSRQVRSIVPQWVSEWSRSMKVWNARFVLNKNYQYRM